MNIAAIIIGIDGWERYTLPLIKSIQEYEPGCAITVIDNLSEQPYPKYPRVMVRRHYYQPRLCYSAAINLAHGDHGVRNGTADWYIVLSNDVICNGPFADMLASYGDGDVVGPLLREELGFAYLEGWCVCIPRAAWDATGGFDERFLGSDYEDVAFSTAARQRGFGLIEDTDLPFKHLDQRQRFHVVPDFAGKNAHNRELFLREYGRVTA